MNGIIPLFKPKGFTSHDCVMKVRKLLKQKKVGHTGTLDPNVEGVLPICVGEATKVIPFLKDLKKEYIADVSLGSATTTEDSDGEIIQSVQMTSMPKSEQIEDVLQLFKGEIVQIPPMYSAVKVNGKKLYEYARNGIEVERPQRKITIFELEYLTEQVDDTYSFTIRALCSKGTYIRTLCVDIGNKLGYPAHMLSLIRTKSDGISLKDTITFDKLENCVQTSGITECMLPVTHVLFHVQTVEVDALTKQKVRNGQKLPIPNGITDNSMMKLMFGNELLAIYERHKKDNQLIKPVRVFNLYKSEGEQ